MHALLLLAQSAETAEKTVGLLERVLQGGVPLICLAAAVICGLGFYWQLRQNKKMNEDALAKAEARETAKDSETKTRLSEQEALLREMLDRDREAQEGHQAATQAVEGFSRALQDQQRTCESTTAEVRELIRRIGSLEDTIRRFRDGSGTG